MYTRKRIRKKRKTKRGGLGSEVYMMAGLLTALNGIMMSIGSFSGYDPCDTALPVATPIYDLS